MPGKPRLAGRSIELYRDFLVQKVAFFKTLSKKHKRWIDFKTTVLHFLRCREGLLRSENGALEVPKQLLGGSPRENWKGGRKERPKALRGRSESAQTTLRGAQRTLRGPSEDVQMADWQRCTSNTEVDRNRTPASAPAPAPALATEPFWARVPG